MIDFVTWLENTIPIGDCFRFATMKATEMFADGIMKDIKVVHALVKPQKKKYEHAWIEADGRCFDWQMSITGKHSLPIKEFYEFYKPTNIKKYTPTEAIRSMIQNKHHGPW